MNRRELIKRSAALGAMVAIPSAVIGCSSARAVASISSGTEGTQEKGGKTVLASNPVVNPLKPPSTGNIPVAFVISEGLDPIDTFGPWDVFHQAVGSVPFHPYSVGESLKPVNLMGGGIKLVPQYTFANAPFPKVVVIPAQQGNPAMLDWIRKVAKTTDVTFSVCTGAELLARTGLLSGRSATTHHGDYRSLAVTFTDIKVQRGVRFVEDGNLATAAGLSSGIDLALRVVERYFGRNAAKSTAYQLEYQGEGWMNPASNAVYAAVKDSTEEHPLCPVCEMAVDPATAPKTVYKGKTYYFMAEQHKKQFEAEPEKFIKAAEKKL
jgi:putative intracellular protease/amidase/YHS domain-containing protein